MIEIKQHRSQVGNLCPSRLLPLRTRLAVVHGVHGKRKAGRRVTCACAKIGQSVLAPQPEGYLLRPCLHFESREHCQYTNPTTSQHFDRSNSTSFKAKKTSRRRSRVQSTLFTFVVRAYSCGRYMAAHALAATIGSASRWPWLAFLKFQDRPDRQGSVLFEITKSEVQYISKTA